MIGIDSVQRLAMPAGHSKGKQRSLCTERVDRSGEPVADCSVCSARKWTALKWIASKAADGNGRHGLAKQGMAFEGSGRTGTVGSGRSANHRYEMDCQGWN